MQKKIILIMLFVSPILSSDPSNETQSDPNYKKCLTCYVLSCTAGTALTAGCLCIPPETLIFTAPAVSSCCAYKAAKTIHACSVDSFDHNNSFDQLCSNLSGIVAAKYSFDCCLYGQCPHCALPVAAIIMMHNALKIAEQNMTDPFAAPYNLPPKKIDGMQ